MENFEGIHNLDLDQPSQVEFNRRKNLEQDSQIANLTSQLNQLLSQAPAGYLPRVYYGLTSGNQTYRFTEDAEATVTITGAIGTAFTIYSDNESDNGYIPAVAVKTDDTTIKIIIQGDYRYDSSAFTAVNMTTGASTSLTLSGVLSLQDASSLSDYPAEDNKEKQITVLNDLETNSKNVIFASLDYNSDGTYNWVEIGNFVDGIDGKSILTITSDTYSNVISLVKINDTLLAGEAFTAGGTTFAIGDLYTVTSISPLTLTSAGNIRGATGETGETGAAGQDGADGYTPYIQDNYWYINGVNTNVKALGTDGTNGTNGQSFQTQSGLYSVPANWGETGNVDGDGNALLQLPTLPTTGITGKGYVVYDPLTTPLSPFYDLYWANDGDNDWTIMHPYSGIAGQDGTDGSTPYIQNNTWYIDGVSTGVSATGPQGPAGPGVPTGGTAGQVLTKVDSTDYNTQWATASGGMEVLTGSSEPTASTVGQIGQLYVVSSTPFKVFTCVRIYNNGNSYMWSNTGSGADDLYIGTGKNAGRVVIGTNKTVGNNSVAIGNSATAYPVYSIAIGSNAKIEANAATYAIQLGDGTNSTSYTLQVGADNIYNRYNHTATFKNINQGVTSSTGAGGNPVYGVIVGTSAPTTSTVGEVGQVYFDSTNVKEYICSVADTVTPSYTWNEVAGGVFGDIVSRFVTGNIRYFGNFNFTQNSITMRGRAEYYRARQGNGYLSLWLNVDTNTSTNEILIDLDAIANAIGLVSGLSLTLGGASSNYNSGLAWFMNGTPALTTNTVYGYTAQVLSASHNCKVLQYYSSSNQTHALTGAEASGTCIYISNIYVVEKATT